LVSSWSVWSCLARLCVGFSFRAGCVLGVFFPGPREVTEALWNTCCATTVATGLTGAVHRSDRCHQSDQLRPSVSPVQHKQQAVPLCVLVSFGSEGCLLVPRSSSTSVAVWAWPTWVVNRRRVLEAVFVLLESPSPSRRIFIGSHSPTSLVRRIGPSRGPRRRHTPG
jgi:hypothetical protein